MSEGSGWTEELDETYNRYYFYHAATEQSSWERPAGMVVSEDVQQCLFEQDQSQPDKQKSEEGGGKEEEGVGGINEVGDDAANWTVEWDENYNCEFYYNVRTNETSWECPASITALRQEGTGIEQTQEEGGKNTAASTAVENWTVEWDTSFGCEFFFNSVTQESSWEKPACMVKNEEEGGQKKGEETVESEVEEGNKMVEDITTQVSEVAITVEKRATRKNSIKPRPSVQPKSSVMRKKSILGRISMTIPPPPPLTPDSPKAFRRQSTAPRPSNLPPKPLNVREEFRNEISNLYQKMGERKPTIIQENVEEESDEEDVKNAVSSFLSGTGSQMEEFKTTGECLEQYDGIEFSEYAADNFKLPKKGSSRNLMTMDGAIEWQKDLIKAPFLKHTDQNMEKLAVQMFKNISSAMSDRSSSKKMEEHVHKVVTSAISSGSESLCDEIYCHLCKQTTNNPKETSNILGWKLFLICLSCFPPGRDLFPYLMAYFCSSVKNGTGFVPSYAEKCIQNSQRIVKDGACQSVPPVSGIMALSGV